MTRKFVPPFDATSPLGDAGVFPLTPEIRFHFLRQAIGHLELEPGEKVLDVCAGTGASIEPIASQVGEKGEVVGLDLSRDMLRVAERRFGHEANVRFVYSDIATMEGYDAYFDKALMSFCMSGIGPARRTRTLHQIRRMLTAGGLLVVADFDRLPEEKFRTSINTGMRTPEHDERYSRLGRVLTELLTDQGFARLEAVPFLRGNLLIVRAVKTAL